MMGVLVVLSDNLKLCLLAGLPSLLVLFSLPVTRLGFVHR